MRNMIGPTAFMTIGAQFSGFYHHFFRICGRRRVWKVCNYMKKYRLLIFMDLGVDFALKIQIIPRLALPARCLEPDGIEQPEI